ncbi:hypothetical protein LCGC14_2356330, partial [marine sediment metagenome]
ASEQLFLISLSPEEETAIVDPPENVPF